MRNIPHCCLPQESGPCLSPGVEDHPLRSPTRHRHGEPLPRHPADGPQPPPQAPRPSAQPFASTGPPVLALSRISRRFQRLSRSSGQVSYVLRTRAPLSVHRSELPVRLACVRHAANVHPEPGSNSPFVPHAHLYRYSVGPGTRPPAGRTGCSLASHSPVVKLRPEPSPGPAASQNARAPRKTPPLYPVPPPLSRPTLLAPQDVPSTPLRPCLHDAHGIQRQPRAAPPIQAPRPECS